MDKPQHGKIYALTGGKNDKAISNGNTWAESEIKPKNIVRQWFANWENGLEPQSDNEKRWRKLMERYNQELNDRND